MNNEVQREGEVLFLRRYVRVLKPERAELSSNFSDIIGEQGKTPLHNCGVKISLCRKPWCSSTRSPFLSKCHAYSWFSALLLETGLLSLLIFVDRRKSSTCFFQISKSKPFWMPQGPRSILTPRETGASTNAVLSWMPSAGLEESEIKIFVGCM